MKANNIFHKVIIALLLAVMSLFLFYHLRGYESSIDWNVTTTAESESFYTLPFKKGPFQFSFQAEKYELAETFSAGPIERNPTQEQALLVLILIGFCLMLTAATFLTRYWFIGIMGLFIFFVMNLHLPEVGFFGFGERSSLPVIIVLAAYLLPAYYFHAFGTSVHAVGRVLTFSGITAILVLLSGVDTLLLHDQFISGGYFGLVVLSLIFLLLIAEENVYAILYLITQSKGGKNNHVHFSIFSACYLGLLIAYYGNKSALIDVELEFFNPYVLLMISSVVTLWTLQHKKPVLEKYLSMPQVYLLFCGLGIVVMAFLGHAFMRGNDAIYEGMHYFIIYVHVGFGVMFFLYLFWNFIAPLGEGLQVYKIAYREQNFPYITAKLAGLAAVAGFFFLANKEPFLLFQSGHYNYLGAKYEEQGERMLADEYYREGSIYGYDNHFSNYKMGYRELQKGAIKEANFRFRKATKRHPSAQAYINHAGTFAKLNETTPLLVTLQDGLRIFPDNNQLLNNLGLTYIDMGKYQDAAYHLQQAEPDEWTNATLVNLWKVVEPDAEVAAADYQRGNLATKANVLSGLIGTGIRPDIAFDSTDLYPSYPMHRLAFLINSSWYFANEAVAPALEKSLTGMLDESMYHAGKNALVMSHYQSGNINQALKALDILIAEVASNEQHEYLNQAGLIALSQHAPALALDFFEKAIARGSNDALLNKTACLLELGMIAEGLAWTQHLVTIDSVYAPVANDILTMDMDVERTLDQQLFKLYYHYENYSPAEINSMLAQADEPYVHSLWAKISKEQLLKQNFDQLKNYRAVFNAYLDKSFFEEPELLMTLANDQRLNNNHTLAQALLLENEEERVRAIKKLANQNALNEPLVLTVTDILRELNPTEAYDVLVNAINIHQTSVALHKAYIMTALETGLEAYANDALQELTTLTTQEDYQAFYQQYLTRKSALDEATW